MAKTIALFGHRRLWGKDIRERLTNVIKTEIEKYDEVNFLIGNHGDFDSLTLSVCRELRKSYPQIKITVVFTSLHIMVKHKDELFTTLDLYKDVQTMMYEIEEEHYKNQIVVSNRRMVDDSDLIICYVDMNEYRSGAKRAIKYAIKQNKPVINIFSEQDKPFYGMTSEEIDKEWEKIKRKLDKSQA